MAQGESRGAHLTRRVDGDGVVAVGAQGGLARPAQRGQQVHIALVVGVSRHLFDQGRRDVQRLGTGHGFRGVNSPHPGDALDQGHPGTRRPLSTGHPRQQEAQDRDGGDRYPVNGPHAGHLHLCTRSVPIIAHQPPPGLPAPGATSAPGPLVSG